MTSFGYMAVRMRFFFALAVFAVIASIFIAGGSAYADAIKDRMESLAGSKTPVEIQADKAEYDRKTGVYTAEGHVSISQGDVVLTADSARLEMNTGLAEATGKVTLTDKENVLMADKATVNFDTSLGVIEKGSIFVKKENYHITGNRMERLSENEYIVDKGSLTTCDAATPFWMFTADDIKVRMDRDVQASNVVMRIMDVPVLYSPYAWFPLLKPRTTGFMIPGFGFNTSDGFRFYNSFYWAPVDNFDATMNIDYRSERGVGLSSELRFAFDKNSSTRLYGYYMDDRKDLRQRYNFELQHTQELTEALDLKADVHLSDRKFYKDLTDTTLDRTKRSIDSNVFLTNTWDNSLAYVLAQYTLDFDISRNNDVVVQKLPEAGFNIISKKVDGLPLYIDTDGSAAYFNKRRGVDGGRFDLFPKLTGAFDLGGISILPKAGYRETLYKLNGEERLVVRDPVTNAVIKNRLLDYDSDRGLFGAGVTVQTELSRLYDMNWGGLQAIKHTLEPKVAYNYVGALENGLYPKFDGIDTLGRRSMVAYSLSNRFVFKYAGDDGKTRLDYLTFKLSQFYDSYKDTRVQGELRRFSSIYGEVVYMASYGVNLNADFRYNAYSGKLQSVNTDIKYQDAKGNWHFVLGHRYSTDTDLTFMSPSRFDFFTPSTDYVSDFEVAKGEDKVNFLMVGVGANLPAGWSLDGKVWYDIHSDKLRETDISARYDSQCWGVTLQYVKRPSEEQYLVLFEFKGIGAVKI